MRFKSFYEENELNEAMLLFDKSAYPKFGNIVIVAGGSRSGKGFIQEQLMGIEGKVFDVDELKDFAMGITSAQKKFPELERMSKEKEPLKNPDNVRKLHEIVVSLNLQNKREQALVTSVLSASQDRKPNIIFDVTLKDVKKLKHVSKLASQMGYKKENIHIVWVLQDFKISMELNKDAPRFVPDDIVIGTHTGVIGTMNNLLDIGSDLRKYMDGFFYIVFNRKGIDASINIEKQNKRGSNILFSKKRDNLITIKKALIIKVKDQGKSVIKTFNLIKLVKKKIKRLLDKKFIANTNTWIKGLLKGNI